MKHGHSHGDHGHGHVHTMMHAHAHDHAHGDHQNHSHSHSPSNLADSDHNPDDDFELSDPEAVSITYDENNNKLFQGHNHKHNRNHHYHHHHHDEDPASQKEHRSLSSSSSSPSPSSSSSSPWHHVKQLDDHLHIGVDDEFNDSDSSAIATWRFMVLLCCSYGYVFGLVILAIVTRSSALFSESIHASGDAIVYTLNVWIHFSASRNTSFQYPYARTRLTVVGALLSSVFILFGVMFVVFEAIQTLIFGVPKFNGHHVMLISMYGLIANVIALCVLPSAHALLHTGDHGHSHGCGTDHGHSHGAHGHNDLNMMGIILHVAGDCFTCAIVFTSGCIESFTSFEYRYYADPVACLMVSSIIFMFTYPLMLRSLPILMQSCPKNVFDKRHQLIQDLNECHRGISVNLNDVKIWEVTPDERVSSIVVAVDYDMFQKATPASIVAINRSVKSTMASYGCQHTTVEIIQNIPTT